MTDTMDRNEVIAIRALRRGDHSHWLALWRGYQAFYKVSIPPDVTDLTFSGLLDSVEPMRCALALRGETIVGLVHFIRHRSTWTAGDYCYLQDLFTDEAARGLGAGRALIEHVYARAREWNCSRVYWLTHETNAQAMVLYGQVAERSGFIQYRKGL